jgi:hypothetical protein
LSVVYLIALIAVCMTLLAAAAEAIWSVSCKPVWNQSRHELRTVQTQERRTQDLPFVGAERRRATALDPDTTLDEIAA